MKALVVGLGSAGRRHARNWAALGLGDVLVLRRTDLPQPEPLGVDVRFFRDMDAALAQRPDVVIIANPTSLHLATACAAIAAGCHVLVEKPLSHTLDGVGDFLGAVSQSGRQVSVGYNLRFHPGLRRMRELLRAGAIGKPLTARAEMGEWLPGWHPWEDYRQGYSARRGLGGGPILTFSHELDSLCWLLGPPHRVVCLAARTSNLDVDVEDVAEIAFQFPGGVVASVHADFVRRPPRRFLEVTGEMGVLRWEYDENRLLISQPETREWRMEQGSPHFERNDMFLDELRDLARAIRGEQERPLVDAWQGAAILSLAIAAQTSADDGRAIDLQRDLPGETAQWLTSLAR